MDNVNFMVKQWKPSKQDPTLDVWTHVQFLRGESKHVKAALIDELCKRGFVILADDNGVTVPWTSTINLDTCFAIYISFELRLKE